LNVFPEDVERVVAGLAGVRDIAVVGARTGSEERVHAVVVLDPGIDPQAIVRQANLGLLDHQKIRGISVWPSGELPRTEARASCAPGAATGWPPARRHGQRRRTPHRSRRSSRSSPAAARSPRHDTR
jgi:acyl-CoA synthetase (AMP-forming)/AMP-acid ligase II